ncbi:MAG: tyrosine-protein kinase [Solirubrobacteraceae bacterium]|jgi:Mrp family chromosome partitioning ATPase|nr:tyrosine-protein kinase [Solirubrobacteraceae bacterium]
MNRPFQELQGEEPARATRAPDYLGVARRLRIPLLALLVAMPVVTLFASMLQSSLYRSSSEVLLSYQNFATGLSGVSPATVDPDPARIAATQARLARTPLVARQALTNARVTRGTPEEFLAISSVRAEPNADLLVFSAEDPDRDHAARLATAYAHAYTTVARQLATGAIERARQGALRRIQQLEQAGDTRSRLYTSLVTNEQQLRAMSALQTSNASVVRPGDEAVRVQPRPLRDAVLALTLAIVFAACLIALSLAFDTRVREAEEAGGLLGLPLLARLPVTSRRPWRKNRLVMLDEPNGMHAQPYRMLKTTFEFAAFAADARTIMVTSGARREGKSTTAANLALALARAGRRVALVDFDLREPTVHRLVERRRAPGLSDVLLGRVTLGRAMISLWPTGGAGKRDAERTNGERSSHGSLEVLTAGRPVLGRASARAAGLDVSEIAGSAAFDTLLAELRQRADVVLFDTPPVLQASEALTLTRKVDAVIVAVSADISRRKTLTEVCRMLEASAAVTLGFVFYGPGAEYVYGYGNRPAEPRVRGSAKQQAVR